MNRIFTLLGTALLLGSVACNNRHEVVPAPLPEADLECSCKATIDGVEYEYIDTCTYDNNKNISTSSNSTARYSAKVNALPGANLSSGFELEMRTISWVDDGSNLPATEEWKDYFRNNLDPNYYIDDALSPNGVTVTWIDPQGGVWKSDTVSTECPAIDFLFTAMEHDSDDVYNYMKFRAVFNGPLIKQGGTPDTVCVQNGVMKTAFRRE
jgi:hypothetical protein